MNTIMRLASRLGHSGHSQLGGTLMGVIVGLVVGLAIALAVAMYVTKAPVNFSQKTQNRTPEQDAKEAKKNKDWDPNAPLYGKNPARPAAPPASSSATPANTSAGPVSPGAPAAKPATPLKPGGDPIADLVQAKTASPQAPATPDASGFYVQAGAFRSAPEAETQRAKLAMAGLDAKVVERAQSGQSVFRVRIGPFDKREDADKAKQKVDLAGIEALIVRSGR